MTCMSFRNCIGNHFCTSPQKITAMEYKAVRSTFTFYHGPQWFVRWGALDISVKSL